MALPDLTTPISAGVDRQSPLPLYHQLKETLLTLIDGDKLRVGEAIPTERELGERFGVSRITVRRAIDELAREGRLVTRQGKGTFVAPPKIERHISKLKSFTQEMVAEGHRPGSVLLLLRHEPEPGHGAAALNIDPDTPLWIVERLRLADGEPMSLSLAYLHLPPEMSLSPLELQQEVSLWSLLERKGIAIVRTDETLEAVAAGERQAELLQTKKGAPLLLVEGIAYASGPEPVEYHRIYNRGDRSKYSVQTIR
jgi:GntR family transcriptional regulator